MMAANGYWYTLMQGPANGPDVWTATIVVRASEAESDAEPTIRQQEPNFWGGLRENIKDISYQNMNATPLLVFDFIDNLWVGGSGIVKSFARTKDMTPYHLDGRGADAQEAFEAEFGVFQMIGGASIGGIGSGVLRASAVVEAELAASPMARPVGTGTVLRPKPYEIMQAPEGYAKPMVGGMAKQGPKGPLIIDPVEVRYSQNTISYEFKSYPGTIDDLANGLRNRTIDPMTIEPIRLTIVDDLLYSLDNRRLWAFKQAQVNVPYRMATPTEVAKESWKFSTTNQGSSVIIKGKK